MSLNIKNPAVHEAVRDLAAKLGVSQTSAVEIAVREKLAAVAVPAGDAERADRLRGAIEAAQRAFEGIDLRSAETALYDEATGLPR